MTWIVEIEMVPCKICQFQTHLRRGEEKRQGGDQEVAPAKTELQVTLARQVPSQCLFKFDRPCVAELRKRRILQFSDYIEVLPAQLISFNKQCLYWCRWARSLTMIAGQTSLGPGSLRGRRFQKKQYVTQTFTFPIGINSQRAQRI